VSASLGLTSSRSSAICFARSNDARVFFLAEPLQGVAQISMSQRAGFEVNRTFILPDGGLEIPAAVVNGAEVGIDSGTRADFDGLLVFLDGLLDIASNVIRGTERLKSRRGVGLKLGHSGKR